MFCPSCGQEQITEDTRFCSRCGFLLTGVPALLYSGGVLPEISNRGIRKKRFYQKKGFKQGIFIFFLSVVILSIVGLLSAAANVREPYFFFFLLFLLVGGSFLRMAYSVLFEADESDQGSPEQASVNAQPNYLGNTNPAHALPPQQSIPVSGYTPPRHGNWRDTNDLIVPSVTDGTTKLFENEK